MKGVWWSGFVVCWTRLNRSSFIESISKCSSYLASAQILIECVEQLDCYIDWRCIIYSHLLRRNTTLTRLFGIFVPAPCKLLLSRECGLYFLASFTFTACTALFPVHYASHYFGASIKLVSIETIHISVFLFDVLFWIDLALRSLKPQAQAWEMKVQARVAESKNLS